MINRVLKALGVILITAFSVLLLYEEAGTHYFECMLFPLLLGGFELFFGVRYLLCYRTNRKTNVAFESIRAVVGGLLCFGAIIILFLDVLCVEVYYALGLICWISINIIGIVFEKPYPDAKKYAIFCVAICCFLGFSLLRPLVILNDIHKNPVDILNSDLAAVYALMVIIPLLLAQWELFLGMRYLLFEKNKSILKAALSWVCAALGGVMCCFEIGLMFGMTTNLNPIRLFMFIPLPFHIVNLLTDRKVEC